jgi:hypothetical protein
MSKKKRVNSSPDERMQRDIQKGIADAMNAGHLQIVGHDADGSPRFALTEKGMRYVEEKFIKKGGQK